MTFSYYYLTCNDQLEAQKIADALLNKKLVACVKFTPVTGAYWWEGSIERGGEVLMIMESAEELFDDIEKEVAKQHSYETFVLTAVPARTTSKVQAWLNSVLDGRA